MHTYILTYIYTNMYICIYIFIYEMLINMYTVHEYTNMHIYTHRAIKMHILK
jgi:hypothetical protein